MKRKVLMALAIGAGCCLITGNVLIAQPSTSQWEYVEQTDDGMLVFRMGEIELKVPENWKDSYVRKEDNGGEAFYLKDSDAKEKNKLFWLKDSEGLQALWDEEYRAKWETQKDNSDSEDQKTEDDSDKSQNDSQGQENQNSEDNSDSTEEQGFRFAYEKVLTDKMITEMLGTFYDTGARVILRHTQQYDMYRFLSWHPDYVDKRMKREQILAVIHRKGETKTQKKIHDYEIQDLLENDIPYFRAEGRDRCIYTGDGKRVNDYFLISPYEAWKIHMKDLGKKDCRHQCDLIWLSMTMQRKNRNSSSKICSGFVQKEQVVRHIKNIITWIVDTAVVAEDGAGWIGLQFFENGLWKMVPAGMYLYEGISGIALLLGEYLKYFQDEKAKDIFNLAVKRLCVYTQELETGLVKSGIRTGIVDGECSIVYTFMILYEITGEKKYLHYAEKHFTVIKKYFSQDANYDLLSGNAGAAIAALKLYQIKKECAEPEEQYLTEAVEIERKLWDCRQDMENGCGWTIFNVKKLWQEWLTETVDF